MLRRSILCVLLAVSLLSCSEKSSTITGNNDEPIRAGVEWDTYGGGDLHFVAYRLGFQTLRVMITRRSFKGLFLVHDLRKTDGEVYEVLSSLIAGEIVPEPRNATGPVGTWTDVVVATQDKVKLYSDISVTDDLRKVQRYMDDYGR